MAYTSSRSVCLAIKLMLRYQERLDCTNIFSLKKKERGLYKRSSSVSLLLLELRKEGNATTASNKVAGLSSLKIGIARFLTPAGLGGVGNHKLLLDHDDQGSCLCKVLAPSLSNSSFSGRTRMATFLRHS
jgi:hypothetical protein